MGRTRGLNLLHAKTLAMLDRPATAHANYDGYVRPISDVAGQLKSFFTGGSARDGLHLDSQDWNLPLRSMVTFSVPPKLSLVKSGSSISGT